jgi:insertion element IS1 protein InsB
MWSFVGKKRQIWWAWAWAAPDAVPRRVVAMIVGDRSESTAQHLRDALPEAYQAGAMILTDSRAACRAIIHAGRHTRCGKGEGKTDHDERSWCTVRQRCGRFLRKSPSSSKCVSNHVGALRYFIHHDNASLR